MLCIALLLCYVPHVKSFDLLELDDIWRSDRVSYKQIHQLSPIKTLTLDAAQNETVVGSTILLSGLNDPQLFHVELSPMRRLSVKSQTVLTQRESIKAPICKVQWVQSWYQAGNARHAVKKYGNNDPLLVNELLVNDPELVQLNHEHRSQWLNLRGHRLDSKPYHWLSADSPFDLKFGHRAHVDAQHFFIRDSAHLKSINLEYQQFRQIWLSCRVSDSVPVGHYRSVLKVSSQFGQKKIITLDVRVHSITLPDVSLDYAIYYRGRLSRKPAMIGSDWKTRQQYLAEMKNLVSHGVRYPTLYQSYKNLDLIKEELSLRKQAGIDNTKLYWVGFNTSGYDSRVLVRKKLRALRHAIKSFKPLGVEQIYVYGIDEAEEQVVRLQEKFWRRIRHIGVKVFSANYQINSLQQLSNINTVIDGYRNNNKSYMGLIKNKAEKILRYNQPQVGVESPQDYRRAYGLELLYHGYDGAMVYAYQDAFGFIWNDFDHPVYRDHVFAYPTYNGVVDTLAWEAFRTAIHDVAYAEFYKKKLIECKRQAPDWREILLPYIKNPENFKRFVISQLPQLQSC